MAWGNIASSLGGGPVGGSNPTKAQQSINAAKQDYQNWQSGVSSAKSQAEAAGLSPCEVSAAVAGANRAYMMEASPFYRTEQTQIAGREEWRNMTQEERAVAGGGSYLGTVLQPGDEWGEEDVSRAFQGGAAANMPTEEKAVYLAIVDGYTDSSQLEIATGLTGEEVGRALSQLVKKGFIRYLK